MIYVRVHHNATLVARPRPQLVAPHRAACALLLLFILTLPGAEAASASPDAHREHGAEAPAPAWTIATPAKPRRGRARDAHGKAAVAGAEAPLLPMPSRTSQSPEPSSPFSGGAKAQIGPVTITPGGFVSLDGPER